MHTVAVVVHSFGRDIHCRYLCNKAAQRRRDRFAIHAATDGEVVFVAADVRHAGQLSIAGRRDLPVIQIASGGGGQGASERHGVLVETSV